MTNDTREPVLIIHGVANHDPGPFHANVDKLQARLADKCVLIPVDWGDLGGQATDIEDCLPVWRDGDWGVRAGEDTAPPEAEQVRGALGDGTLANDDRADLILGSGTSPAAVRAPLTPADAELHAAIVRALPNTVTLRHLDDPRALRAVGEALRAAVAELPEAGDGVADAFDDGLPPIEGVRGDDEAVRGRVRDRIGAVASAVMSAVDEAIGHVVGNQAGRLNQAVRGRLMTPLSGFAGDILVYQRQPERIRARLLEALRDHAPGHGTRERPVRVMAHSLGGVVAFDAAVNPREESERLWMKSFLTFGSQAAFFHLIDPRVPALAAYRSGSPVTLPASVGAWTNLWDTLDVLAFTAGTVFRMADGSRPVDQPQRDSASGLVAAKLWAHSVYWETGGIEEALRAQLAA